MKKKFDAVDFQRKRRAKLSAEYQKNPKAFLKKLREILNKRKKAA